MNKTTITILAVAATIVSIAFILRPTPRRDAVKVSTILYPYLTSREAKALASDKTNEQAIRFIRGRKAECESYAQKKVSLYEPRRSLELEGLRRCEAIKKIFSRY